MQNSLSKGTIYLTISSLLFLGSGYFINILLGRNLGPSDYGIYGIIISLISLINIMQTSGVPQTVSKYIAQNTKHSGEILKSGFIIQIISTLVITVIYLLLAKPIAIILKDLSLIPYLQLSALILPTYGIFSLYVGFYNGLHDFFKQALINTIYSLSKLIFVILFLHFFYIKGILFGFILSPIIALFAGLQLPTMKKSYYQYKKIILFSIPLVGFAFISTLQLSLDLFFLKILSSNNQDLGFFTASQNISRIPYFGLSALSQVIFPQVSLNVYQGKEDAIQNTIKTSLRYMVVILVPIIVIISATSTQLIELLYSRTYLPAAPSLSILVIALGFLTVFNLFANILSGAGSPKKSFLFAAIGVLVSIFFCLILIPIWGLIGAALASTVGSFVSMLIAGFNVYSRFKVLISFKSVSRILFASLIIYIITKFFNPSILQLPIVIIICFGLYFCLLIATKEINKRDDKYLFDMFPFKNFKYEKN